MREKKSPIYFRYKRSHASDCVCLGRYLRGRQIFKDQCNDERDKRGSKYSLSDYREKKFLRNIRKLTRHSQACNTIL